VTIHEGLSPESSGQPPSRSVTYIMSEWRKEQWSNTLESLHSEDQVLWKMTKG